MSQATNVKAVQIVCVEHKMREMLTKTPGAYYLIRSDDLRDIVAMMISCPSGCGALTRINLSPRYGTYWSRTGGVDTPTLTPSLELAPIFANQDVEPDGSHWNGTLLNGVWWWVGDVNAPTPPEPPAPPVSPPPSPPELPS